LPLIFWKNTCYYNHYKNCIFLILCIGGIIHHPQVIIILIEIETMIHQQIMKKIKIYIGTRANLQGANLEGRNLYGADLREAYLIGADLTNSQLQGAFLQGAHLDGAKLQGAHLREANLFI
jgi:uncharacterized protein YjbI with pentapeptide repeats